MRTGGEVGMTDQNLAKILFRPMCGECGRELNSVVDYQRVYFRGLEGLVDGFVEPGRCPYCGAFFTGMEMPTRLPFDNIHIPLKGE